MTKDKIFIAEQTLKILENTSWSNLNIDQIAKSKKKLYIKNKNELLTNINRYFDYLLRKNTKEIENSSSKDMVFEIIMQRLDILNLHRKAIKRTIDHLSSNPHLFLKLLPSFIESIILIASLANIKINGVSGAARIKSILILYFLIIYTWNKDQTSSLEKTMTTMDNYLTNLNKIIKL